MISIEPIKNWYGRYERPISSISLVWGFIFDAITLKRVDTLWETIWVLGHILIVAIFMILVHTRENSGEDEKNPSKAHFWYVNIIQFFFGGILSTYLVFYFRSADIFVTWPFIVILALAFYANESFKRQYIRLSFQISLLFLSIYSFAIFLLPVILKKISTGIFLYSGLVSIFTIFLFILILFYFAKDKLKESSKTIFISIFSITILVNALYFTNLIPPMPLSLKEGSIYYFVEKNNSGDYRVLYEKKGWQEYFKLYKDFKKAPNTPVYAYTAIFSPNGFKMNILHEWEYYDETKEEWVYNQTIYLSVVGGRDDGFRTYSIRQNLKPGKWRVNVLTPENKLIGRLRLNIQEVLEEPFLTSEIKL